MKIIKGLVDGAFKNEREFKQAVLKVLRETQSFWTCFEIENEEKAPGMPDALIVDTVFPAVLVEFKYADINGVIQFERTQPLFYKRYKHVIIYILAWDRRMGGWLVQLNPSEVLKTGKLHLTLPEPGDIKSVFDYRAENGRLWLYR